MKALLTHKGVFVVAYVLGGATGIIVAGLMIGWW